MKPTSYLEQFLAEHPDSMVREIPVNTFEYKFLEFMAEQIPDNRLPTPDEIYTRIKVLMAWISSEMLTLTRGNKEETLKGLTLLFEITEENVKNARQS